MSVAHYRDLVEMSERRNAVAEALASVRAEGLEPSTEDLGMFAALAGGEISTDQLRDQVLRRYPR
jgi:hypothetical protein